MISYIKGEIIDITDDKIIIDNNGMGYNVFMPANALSNLRAGDEEVIFTYLSVREDSMNLYGFLTSDDLDIFKLLLGVSGIGPKGALGILSAITPDELRFAVFSDDVKTISKAPGIGGKTAQKLIIELKDKMKIEDILPDNADADFENPEAENTVNEAVLALVALGYSRSAAVSAVKKVDRSNLQDVEDILKAALRML